MKLKTIFKNHSEFELTIEEIIRYALEKIIIDSPASKIPIKEKHMLIEALILRTCALWESFVEKEIILSVILNPQNLMETMEISRNKRLDTTLIRAILFSDSYRGFQDINRLVDFTKSVITDKHNPFLKITPDQKNKIHFAYTIRNYLSHYSKYSRKKLFADYTKVFKYKTFIEPGRFLLKDKGKYFEDLANNFKITSIYMKKIFI